MTLHPRYFIVREAKNEIERAILDSQQKHDLTTAEVANILAELLPNYVKYWIREERHGDQSKKGDKA